MSDHNTTAPSTWGRNFRPGEAAEFMGMSAPTFRRRAKENDFPVPIQVSPRIRIFREADLVAFLQSQASKQAEGAR